MSSPEIRFQPPVNYAELLKLPEDERWEVLNGVPYNITPALEIYRFHPEPDRLPEMGFYTLTDNDSIQVGIFDDLSIPLHAVFA